MSTHVLSPDILTFTAADAAHITVVPYEARYWTDVVSLARALRDESGFHSRIALDEEKLAAQLLIAAKLDNHYFRLCVRGERVLGGFLGHVSTVFFSRELVAQDLAWYVLPAFRTTNAALLLVRDFENWARGHGASHFMLSQATGINVETTRSLYEKLGYRVVGVNSVKG